MVTQMSVSRRAHQDYREKANPPGNGWTECRTAPNGPEPELAAGSARACAESRDYHVSRKLFPADAYCPYSLLIRRGIGESCAAIIHRRFRIADASVTHFRPWMVETLIGDY